MWNIFEKGIFVVLNDYLFKEKLPLLNKAANAYSLRQTTIANNIANATSLNYKPQQVKFEELFQNSKTVAIGIKTDGAHIAIGQTSPKAADAEVVDANIPEAQQFFSGESHVNIDKEMANLAENQIRFRFATNMLKKYFQGMQSAIRGINQ